MKVCREVRDYFLAFCLALSKAASKATLLVGKASFLTKAAGFGRAVEAVHAAVLPLHGERAGVADVVEGDDDVLETDIAAADGAEIPGATGVAEIGMAAEDADGAVAVAPPDVLHVGVVDLLAEGADELHVVDALVAEVAGVVVEAEALVVADGVERALGGGDVEGDLGRVHFEAEVDVILLEGLEDGLPALGEIVVTLLQVGLVGGQGRRRSRARWRSR